jgi:hypothetical protein
MATLSSLQGDQIGRIFAPWVIVYFGQFFENYRSSPHFWSTFSTVKVMNWYCQKWLGLHFGLVFYNSSDHPASPPHFISF